MSEWVMLRDLKLAPEEPEEALGSLAARRLGRSGPLEYRILRMSVDARRELRFVYTIEVKTPKAPSGAELSVHEALPPILRGKEERKGRVVVVGAGPCGLFAAYELAKYGLQPLLLERGEAMEARAQTYERLCSTGVLDPESNVCFGEGGAGAFSDGKLTTRIKDPRSAEVLDLMVACGAPEAIRYLAKPHLGTDGIRTMVINLRKKILELGGEVCFGARLTDLTVRKGQLTGAEFICKGSLHRVDTQALVLAAGHSARDVFEMLLQAGVALEPKPFAMGVRAEHKREMIDRRQFGKFAGHPRLGAADYSLRAKSGERGVYSFCVCPGGEVVCQATEPETGSVNGMSYYARDGENTNGAIVVTVGTKDMPAGPLGGVELQRQLEKAAFRPGLLAPVQRFTDLAAGQVTRKLGSVRPSYRPGYEFADLSAILPDFITKGLLDGFARFERQIPGYGKEALLTGVETRTSSPVRVLRGTDGCSLTVRGLYPAGEGAGYAGGIVSAAVDGLRMARAILERFS